MEVMHNSNEKLINRLRDARWRESMINYAVKQGNYDLLHWCIKSDCSWNFTAILQAVSGNTERHLDCFIYLIEKSSLTNLELRQLLLAVIESDNVLCLLYLLIKQCPLDVTCLHVAAAKASLEILTILHTYNNILWEVGCCAAAAKSGNIINLHWLRVHGCPWNAETTTAAAANGQLICLAYALQAGCPLELSAFIESAINNQVKTLQYLIELGYKYPDNLCKIASERAAFLTSDYLHNIKQVSYFTCKWCGK